MPVVEAFDDPGKQDYVFDRFELAVGQLVQRIFRHGEHDGIPFGEVRASLQFQGEQAIGCSQIDGDLIIPADAQFIAINVEINRQGSGWRTISEPDIFDRNKLWREVHDHGYGPGFHR